jgi:hypothetical protein
MNNLAFVLRDVNRLKEAEVLFKEALDFRKANLMPNHPDIGTSMNNLARVLYDLNRWKEAEVLFRDALNFRKANL